MNSVEALAGDGFATDLDWARFDRIIDVGGSRGTKSLAILRRHPRLTALIVDRPQVIEEAQRYWAEHHADGLERLQFQAANLFESLPLVRRMSTCTRPSCMALTTLPACRRYDGSAKPSAKAAPAAILEIVVPEKGADISSASFDMQMFVGSRGRERTLTEWKAIIQAGGLALEEVVRLRSLGSILVLRAG
jgi:hypothetical protein